METRIQRLYAEARSEEGEGNLKGAVGKYHAILRLDPKLAPAYNNLGRLYFKQASYSDAIGALRHAVQLDGSLASSHALLGVSLYETGHNDAARRELSEAPAS